MRFFSRGKNCVPLSRPPTGCRASRTRCRREQHERASTGTLGVGGPYDRSVPHAAFAATFLHSGTRAPWLKKTNNTGPCGTRPAFLVVIWSGPLHCAQPPYGGSISQASNSVRFFYVPALLDKRRRTDSPRVLFNNSGTPYIVMWTRGTPTARCSLFCER